MNFAFLAREQVSVREERSGVNAFSGLRYRIALEDGIPQMIATFAEGTKPGVDLEVQSRLSTEK